MAAASPTLRLFFSTSHHFFPSPNPPNRKPGSIPPTLSACPAPRRHRQLRCWSSPNTAPSLDLPLLPFQSREVLIPSERKTLHLYEARFLALLEEALYKRKNSFVHFVLDPIAASSPKASFAVRYGCLVQIESVEKLEIGALVSTRGICRVNIMNLLQMEPYLRGAVSPIKDKPRQEIDLGVKISRLRECISNLHNLQMKLKVPKDEPLQTNIKGSLLWSDKEIFEEYNEAFIPGLAERLSFAAYQTVSGMSDAEQLTLQKHKIQAMDSTDTLKRLNDGIEYVENNIRMIAARLAIQDL